MHILVGSGGTGDSNTYLLFGGTEQTWFNDHENWQKIHRIEDLQWQKVARYYYHATLKLGHMGVIVLQVTRNSNVCSTSKRHNNGLFVEDHRMPVKQRWLSQFTVFHNVLLSVLVAYA